MKIDNMTPRLRDAEVITRVKRNIETDDPQTLVAAESYVHLLKTYNVVFDAISDLLSPYDLTLAQFNLLVVLYHTPDHRLQMSEIGAKMSVTRTNITKLVDCLERSGLARRKDSPLDRRVVLAELTDSGRQLVQKVLPDHFSNIRDLWSMMDQEECLELTHLLLKLRSSVLETHTKKKARPGFSPVVAAIQINTRKGETDR